MAGKPRLNTAGGPSAIDRLKPLDLVAPFLFQILRSLAEEAPGILDDSPLVLRCILGIYCANPAPFSRKEGALLDSMDRARILDSLREAKRLRYPSYILHSRRDEAAHVEKPVVKPTKRNIWPLVSEAFCQIFAIRRRRNLTIGHIEFLLYSDRPIHQRGHALAQAIMNLVHAVSPSDF